MLELDAGTLCSGALGLTGGHVHHCRYLGNGSAGTSALARPPPERRFEGIRLESPGPPPPTGPLAHLQVRCTRTLGLPHSRISAL